MSATSDKMTGKAKQTVGKMTNNKELEVKGKIQETSGKAQEATKHIGDKLSEKIGKDHKR